MRTLAHPPRGILLVMPLDVHTIDRLPIPAKGRKEHKDDKVPGLMLRVSSTGKKTWYLWYSVKGDRTRKRMRLGPYGPAPAFPLSDARTKARRMLTIAEAGQDPAIYNKPTAAAPDPDAPLVTLKAIAHAYLERHAKVKKKSWKEDQRRLVKVIIPFFGDDKFAEEIRRRDVIRLLDDVAKRGGTEANLTLAVLRKMFNWAIGRDLLVVNPCQQVPRPGVTVQRDRVLSDEEIRAAWSAFNKLGLQGQVFKMMLVTSQRGQEVKAMSWEAIDLAGGWWTIPATDAKNKLSHRVPLTAMARAILDEIQPDLEARKGWVFPNRWKKGHITTNAAFLKAARELAGQRIGQPVDFWAHDLRRTAASNMASIGVPRLVIGKVLNHVEPGVTAVYDRHAYDTEKRDALERWAARLGKYLTGDKIGEIDVTSDS